LSEFNFQFMKIFMIGFMGCGKSLIGKKLSDRLGYNFIDTDQMIEQRFGDDIPAVFKKHGEKGFRQAENDAIHEIIKKPGNFVISSGGGMPCSEENLMLINFFGTTIYLKRDIDDLAEILKDQTHHRPLLTQSPDLKTTISYLLDERESSYNLAKYIVEITPDQNCDQVVDRIVELLKAKS
jgi:shikimate kinase